jgi:hypothetical protein
MIKRAPLELPARSRPPLLRGPQAARAETKFRSHSDRRPRAEAGIADSIAINAKSRALASFRKGPFHVGGRDLSGRPSITVATD